MRTLLFLIAVLLIGGCATGQAIITSSERSRELPPPRGNLVLPDGHGPHPAVVLMHGCSGLDPAVLESLQAHARYLRDNGFATLILDSFGSRGRTGGEVCGSAIELAHARQYRMVDAFDALDFLADSEEIDGDNIFLMGQSNGGSVALMASQEVAGAYVKNIHRRFKGIVAYYPWCGALSMSDIVTPLLIFGGAKDKWTPPQRCASEADRRKTEEPIEAVIYDGAYHSFDLSIPLQTKNGHQIGGNDYARSDSRRRMLDFYKQLLD